VAVVERMSAAVAEPISAAAAGVEDSTGLLAVDLAASEARVVAEAPSEAAFLPISPFPEAPYRPSLREEAQRWLLQGRRFMPGVDRELPPDSLRDLASQGVLARTIPVTDTDGPATPTITAAGGMHPRGGPTESTTEEPPAPIGRTNAHLSGAGTPTIIMLASAITGAIETEEHRR
jgi:hypothetical protein